LAMDQDKSGHIPSCNQPRGYGGLAEGGRSAQDSILVLNQCFHGLCLMPAEASLEVYIDWWPGISLVVHCHVY
jgi:hypothetical protein